MTQASPARRPDRSTRRGQIGPSGGGGRYGALLLVLIVTYLLSAFSGTELAIQLQIGLFAAVLVLALRTSPLPGRWPLLIGVIALAGTFQYFSFVTLTTLGYGDFTAAGNGGRALAVIEALAGQVVLATLVARLVSAYRTPARQAIAASRRLPRSVRYGPRTIHRGKPRADARGPAGRSSERPARRPPQPGG